MIEKVNKVILVFIILILVFPLIIVSGTKDTDKNINSKVKIKKSLVSRFYEIQRKGNLYINKLLKKLRKGFDFKIFLIIVGFSFVYGIIHTLGPGHGKTIVASYFLQPHMTKSDALSLSIIISIVHTSSAIVLAILFKTVLISLKGYARIRVQYYFTIFSGTIVLILGIFYLILRILKKDENQILKFKNLLDSENNVENIKIEKNSESNFNKKNVFFKNILIGFSVGIVPCPLSMTIMMICFAYNILWIGFLSVISLTVSMVILLYFIALYTMKARNGLTKSFGEKSKTVWWFKQILGYTGNILIILIGAYIIYKGYISAFPST